MQHTLSRQKVDKKACKKAYILNQTLAHGVFLNGLKFVTTRM